MDTGPAEAKCVIFCVYDPNLRDDAMATCRAIGTPEEIVAEIESGIGCAGDWKENLIRAIAAAEIGDLITLESTNPLGEAAHLFITRPTAKEINLEPDEYTPRWRLLQDSIENATYEDES
jgi:hypothetical protein